MLQREINLPKFEEYPIKIPSFRNERLDLNRNGKRYDLYYFLCAAASLGRVRDFGGDIWYWCY
jgi:hypothetical protein